MLLLVALVWFPGTGGRGIQVREIRGRAHLVHVDADCAARGADFAGGEEDVEASAAAEINDGFALQPLG